MPGHEGDIQKEAMGALSKVSELLGKMQKQVGGAKKRLRRRRTKRRRKSRKARKSRSKRRRKSRRSTKRRRRR